MEIANALAYMHDRQQPMTRGDRQLLQAMLGEISEECAFKLYSDISYLYICMATYTPPDKSAMILLDRIYNYRFLQGLVNVGTFMEKLADATSTSPSTRQQKWKYEEDYLDTLRAQHKKNSDWHTKWSQFLFASREINAQAYRTVYDTIDNPKLDWQIVIKSSVQTLSTKPNIFYTNLQLNKLASLEKRAMLHKYSLMYNVLPTATRETMKCVTRDLFLEAYSANPDTECSTVDMRNTSVTCCVLL